MPKSNNNNTPSVTNNPSVVATDQLPEIVGDINDFTRHESAAAAIPVAAVKPCRADVRLAVHNALAARDVIVAARGDLDDAGLRVDWDHLGDLDSLCRAVVYAAARVPAVPGESSDVIALLAEGRPLRARLLTSARLHAIDGRCPAAEVERIARGRGAVDLANDLVDLAFVHTQNALVDAGRSVTDEQVKRARLLGIELRAKIHPAGAARPSRITLGQHIVIVQRDRLWTLLVQAHQQLERAGGALWGRDMPRHVPALLKRAVPRKRPEKPAAPVSPTS